MQYLHDPWLVLAMLAAGVVGGVINTVAGGGSLLILPLLMLSGMGPALANGTMRVGVLLQGLEGVRQFHRRGSIEFSALWYRLWPVRCSVLWRRPICLPRSSNPSC